MSMFQKLPIEVLEEVFSCLEARDLSQCCLVNRHLFSHSHDPLYRAIHIKRFSQEDKVIKTLANSEHGQLARSIKFICNDESISPTIINTQQESEEDLLAFIANVCPSNRKIQSVNTMSSRAVDYLLTQINKWEIQHIPPMNQFSSHSDYSRLVEATKNTLRAVQITQGQNGGDLNKLINVDTIEIFESSNLQMATSIMKTCRSQRLEKVLIGFQDGGRDENTLVNEDTLPTTEKLVLQHYVPTSDMDLSCISNFRSLNRLYITTTELWPSLRMEPLTTVLSRLNEFNITVLIPADIYEPDFHMLDQLAQLETIHAIEIALNGSSQNHEVVITKNKVKVILHCQYIGSMMEIITSLVPYCTTLKIVSNGRRTAASFVSKALKSVESPEIKCINIMDGIVQRENQARLDAVHIERVELHQVKVAPESLTLAPSTTIDYLVLDRSALEYKTSIKITEAALDLKKLELRLPHVDLGYELPLDTYVILKRPDATTLYFHMSSYETERYYLSTYTYEEYQEEQESLNEFCNTFYIFITVKSVESILVIAPDLFEMELTIEKRL